MAAGAHQNIGDHARLFVDNWPLLFLLVVLALFLLVVLALVLAKSPRPCPTALHPHLSAARAQHRANKRSRGEEAEVDGLVATADGTRRVATKFHAAAKGHSTIGRGRAHIELTGVAAKTSKTAPTEHRQVKSRKKGS